MVWASPYVDRKYRTWSQRRDLQTFSVGIETSDLRIQCDSDLEIVARTLLAGARGQVQLAVDEVEGFEDSLDPIACSLGYGRLVEKMCDVSKQWGVGPMASVAGAISQSVGEGLLERCREVIVENGGDLFLRCDEPVSVGLYAGERSPFSDRLAFEIEASEGIGVCTSSAVVGPSLSLGAADAVMAVAPDAAFADAAATSIANRVRSPRDVERVIESEAEAGRLTGLVICCGEALGIWGDLELRSQNRNRKAG